MKFVCDSEKCTGCGLCKNICPRNAIQMVPKETTGHFYPVIDSEKCVDCGLCRKMCPTMDEEEFREPKVVYAAWRKNAGQQKGSSSGGVAAALYETAIANGFYIVGTWTTDDFVTQMKATKELCDIESFTSSKYVQADSDDVYEKIGGLIRQKERVLFIGTPCQCAAARKLYNSKEYLITVDLICHGVPSQSTFRDYLEWIQKKKNKEITEASFRTPYGEEMTLKSKGKVIWKRKMREDYYLDAFNSGMLNNEACYECRYAQEKRASDITIGDFWGIGKKEPFAHPGRKVSVVTVNTQKGMELLSKCDSLMMVERSYEEATQGNTQLRHPLVRHEKRELFWQVYRDEGIEQAFIHTIYQEVSRTYWKNTVKRAPKELVKRLIGRR